MAYTLLKAVNHVLVAGTETPVNSLTTDASSAAALVQGFLDQQRIMVLSEGMQFNTRSRAFSPNSESKIRFGDNILSIDGYGDHKNKQFTIVDNVLYDTEEQTDEFTTDQYLRVVYDYDFEDMPIWVQNRIMTRAALSFATQFAADELHLRDLADLARQAEIRCAEKEFASRNINMSTKTTLGRVLHSGVFNRLGGY